MAQVPSDEELLRTAIPIDLSVDDDEDTIDLGADTDGSNRLADQPVAIASAPNKIRSFGVQRRPHEDHWKRQPNATGQGAIHVKTFFCKLRPEGISHMDEQINRWLDAHPEYEVKFTSSSVGLLAGKTKEEALFVQIWV